MVNVQSWMPKADRDGLARLAEAADRTVSQEVRAVLVRHLETRSAENPLRLRIATDGTVSTGPEAPPR